MPGQGAGLGVLHQHIGLADQFDQQLLASCIAQIERHRTLVAIAERKKVTAAIAMRRQRASRFAAGGFELDHIRAQRTELSSHQWRGGELPHLQHLDAGQRWSQGLGRGLGWRWCVVAAPIACNAALAPRTVGIRCGNVAGAASPCLRTAQW